MNDRPEDVDLTPDVVAPAARDADGVVSVIGILGESTDESSVRIYLDATFATFYDVPRDAVRDRQRVEAADSPFAVTSTVLRIRQGTRISVQHSSSRTIDHEFLAGDFTAPGTFRSLTWGAPTAVGGSAVRYRTNPNDCYPTSPRGGCASNQPPCPI